MLMELHWNDVRKFAKERAQVIYTSEFVPSNIIIYIQHEIPMPSIGADFMLALC